MEPVNSCTLKEESETRMISEMYEYLTVQQEKKYKSQGKIDFYYHRNGKIAGKYDL